MSLMGEIRQRASSLAVHTGTALGAAVLFYSAWVTGGVYSPLLAWLLILPLTPFYVLHRRAGMLWMWVVLAMQLVMALSNQLAWIDIPETGLGLVSSSFLTYSLVT